MSKRCSKERTPGCRRDVGTTCGAQPAASERGGDWEGDWGHCGPSGSVTVRVPHGSPKSTEKQGLASNMQNGGSQRTLCPPFPL